MVPAESIENRLGRESHTTNEEVLFKADTERKLMKRTIKKQQLQFLEHCMKKDGIEKLALTGKIAGTRARGRQRITFLQRIAELSGKSTTELIQCTERRNGWHKLVADVIRKGITRRRCQKLEVPNVSSELSRKIESL